MLAEEEGTWENIGEDGSLLFGQMAARKTEYRKKQIGEGRAPKMGRSIIEEQSLIMIRNSTVTCLRKPNFVCSNSF
jgi:hypothetical protein